MKKKSSPIDSDMNFVSDLGFTDHSETFSASYRGFISRNKKVFVCCEFVQRLLPQLDEHLDEHFQCRNAIFDPLWNLPTVSPSIETLIFLKI